MEIGPKDLAKNETRSVRRDTGKVEQLSLDSITSQVNCILETIQSDMFTKAKKERDSRLVRLETWDKFVDTLNAKCMILAPWCETTACEDLVKEKSARS